MYHKSAKNTKKHIFIMIIFSKVTDYKEKEISFKFWVSEKETCGLSHQAVGIELTKMTTSL
jgi:hypothetical protein